MRQIIERLRPWASTMILVGILAALFESVEERDITSIFILLVALAGAALLLPAKRPLTRDEVRIEIMTGIRAMVHPDALQPRPAPEPPETARTIRSSGSTVLGSPRRDDPTQTQIVPKYRPQDDIETDPRARPYREGDLTDQGH